MHNILEDKIFLNKNNWKPYVLFWNYIYQFNKTIIKAKQIDKETLSSDIFIPLININTELLYKFIKAKFDNYKILSTDWTFLKKWRLLYYNLSNKSELAIIVDLEYKTNIKNNQLELEIVTILTESGVLIEIHQTLIKETLSSVTSISDMMIDEILEILFFYDLEWYPLNISQFRI